MANAAARNATGGAASPKAAAKEAKAKAKAGKKAEKARKKASDDPKDMGRIRQIGRAYTVTHEYDRALPYLLIGAFVLPVAISVAIGLLWGHPFNVIFAGLMNRLAGCDDHAGSPGQREPRTSVTREGPAPPRWPCKCCPRSGYRRRPLLPIAIRMSSTARLGLVG